MLKDKPTGWSLVVVEAAIMLTVVGVMAAMMVPQFVQAGQDCKHNALLGTLGKVRSQLYLYQLQHEGKYPELSRFMQQVTECTNMAGSAASIGTAGYQLGPYLKHLPVNPYSNGHSVSNGPPGSSDWFYDPLIGRFAANDRAAHRKW